jgi:hypothetical protein
MAVVKPVGASISMCLFTVTSFGSELAEFSTRHEAAVANLFEKFNSYYESRPPNSTDWIIEHSVIVIKKNTRFRKGSVSQNSPRVEASNTTRRARPHICRRQQRWVSVGTAGETGGGGAGGA